MLRGFVWLAQFLLRADQQACVLVMLTAWAGATLG